MANFVASAWTSYAKMRDNEAFIEWASTIPEAEIVTRDTEEHGTTYALLFVNGIPYCKTTPEEDYAELDIFEEIQPHIADGWGIGFQEYGAEGMRHLVGVTVYVTPNEISWINLRDWLNDRRVPGAVGTLPEH